MKTIKQLAEHIGVHPRTMHKMSAHTRAQWQALAAAPIQTYSVAYFNALNRLMFDVAAFNQSMPHNATVSFGAWPSFYVFDEAGEPVVIVQHLAAAADIEKAIELLGGVL